MAKGPAGFGLPMICAFAYVAHEEALERAAPPRDRERPARHPRGRDALVRRDVRPPRLAVHRSADLPRHVQPRVHHVHDTNEGDDTGIRFYIWQLGYALFPWTGLAPLGAHRDWAAPRATRARRADARRDVVGLPRAMWFLFAFALFSFMGTKFHHYIFPAVPPVAMLIGVVLDDMLGDERLAAKGGLATYLRWASSLGDRARASAGPRDSGRASSWGRKEIRPRAGDRQPPRWRAS